MTEDLHILAVGPASLGFIVRDALRNRLRSRFSNVDDLRQLWLVPRGDFVDVAILDATLAPPDLQDASRLIRRQWPAARILVLNADSESLDDALYDERMMPAVTPAALLAAIQRLTGRLRQEYRP
jgi:hypothetical protein